METEFIILYIIGGIIGLIVAFAIAKEFQGIAEDKGYENSKKYFWWTFLLAPYGIAMVIALPDLKARPLPVKPEKIEQSRIEKARRDELPDL